MSHPMSTQSSHLMKTTRRGKPFVKDTHDLFATLLVTLKIGSHRSFFKHYPHSFTVDEACVNLSSLKFSQSNRSMDPKDPLRIITTTTTTTFTMSRDMARGVGQHFMDAHLIENAADLSSRVFHSRGVFMITPKGLHILERFITKNGTGAPEHLIKAFATQTIAKKLLHLERRTHDDEILITKSVLEVVFRRFLRTGKPNTSDHLDEAELRAQYHSRPHSKATELLEKEKVDFEAGLVVRKKRGENGVEEYHFTAMSAVDWLCDYMTVIGIDEAAEVAGQFVRYGYISLVSDPGQGKSMKDGDVVVTVRAGGAGGGAGAAMDEADFRATSKAIYRVTKKGEDVLEWGKPTAASAAANGIARTVSEAASDVGTAGRANGAKVNGSTLVRQPTMSDVQKAVGGNETDDKFAGTDSHTARLKQILEEPALRSLFREFLRANFCEENLSFWLDVQDFKRRFTTSSSAAAGPATSAAQRGQGIQVMEKHQQDLMSMAFVIYNTYLAPASPCELNMDHQLRGEVITYMRDVLEDKDKAEEAETLPGVGNTLHASQLHNVVYLYEKIQGQIFRLMATDSVPKFVKTGRFIALMASVFQYTEGGKENGQNETARPQKEDVSRAYLTISSAANEKEQQLAKANGV